MDTTKPIVQNDIQNKNLKSWKKLCDYIDRVAESGQEEFDPYTVLGAKYEEIVTLPESIRKLKKVKTMNLYGSALKRIPPEIGEMESLENFTPYTSYDLNWFPYEITKCKKLVNSTVSVRALYGNVKYRPEFPDLNECLIRYSGDSLKCSHCEKSISYEETNQMWLSLYVGTDVLPLLANLCSEDCINSLPQPPEDYVQFPHKGGSSIVQPKSMYG